MNFTIFGSHGFIGRNLSLYLENQGHNVWLPSRSAEETLGKDLGHVFYTIGLTGDFRLRPFETVEAHVSKLAKLITSARFDSWLYLSSTRVYSGLPVDEMVKEDIPLTVLPGLDGVYNISKLMGEALCLSLTKENIRIVRLSNVYGYGQSKHTFLASLIDELLHKGKAVIHESPESEKDYVALNDVIPLLYKIALFGQEQIYNIASGKTLTHYDLTKKLTLLTGCSIEFEDHAPCRRFPLIDISRIKNEFGFTPSDFDNNLHTLISESRLSIK